MTPHPSHPSHPWPDPPKRRAMSPRTIGDYNLIAAVVVEFPATSGEVSRFLGREEDYADRLIRSGAGGAFMEWFSQQPDDFVKRFKIGGGQDASARPEATEADYQLPTKPKVLSDGEEALREFGYVPDDREN